MFVLNAWYVAAWDHEVNRDITRRILLNEMVVLFRRDDGTPVALEDGCCHRQTPRASFSAMCWSCPYRSLQGGDPTTDLSGFIALGLVAYNPTIFHKNFALQLP